MKKTIYRIHDAGGKDTGLAFDDEDRAEGVADRTAGCRVVPEHPCVVCGHDVGGRPPEDVKLEETCFPCLAGRLSLDRAALLRALKRALPLIEAQESSRSDRFVRRAMTLVAHMTRRGGSR